jgi:hypothetical protein
MEISSLINNKFIIAIPVALLLLGCMFKFNQFKDLNNENEDALETNTETDGETNDKVPHDMQYYGKLFIVCYLVGLLFVVLIKKGYNYYGGSIKSKLTEKLSFLSSNNNNEEVSKELSKEASTQNESASFNKNEAIDKRELELKNDIKDLNVDVDTSNLEPIEISKPLEPPKYNNSTTSVKTDQKTTSDNKEAILKKKQLLEKRKKLLEMKNKQPNQHKLESFNTGTPDF